MQVVRVCQILRAFSACLCQPLTSTLTLIQFWKKIHQIHTSDYWHSCRPNPLYYSWVVGFLDTVSMDWFFYFRRDLFASDTFKKEKNTRKTYQYNAYFTSIVDICTFC